MRRTAIVIFWCSCIALPALPQDLAQRPFEVSGFAAMNSGDNVRCARIFTQAARRYSHEPSPPFVAARCFARAREMKNAERYLALAFSRGWRACSNLEREPVLAAIPGAQARCAANEEAFVRASNAELLVAYWSDRRDRTGAIVDERAVVARDRKRQDIVRLAIAHKTLHTADDYFHAAWVMQHGSTPDAYDLARTLAKRAVRMRPWFAEARWLYAAATDRYLQSSGKPQIFGTQYRMADGKWTLEPFDRAAISDAERARWRAQSVAERERFIDGLNQTDH